MADAVGAANVSDEVAAFPIDGTHPALVVTPSDIPEMSRAVAAARDGDMAIAPWGGGTRMGLGNAISRLDLVVSLAGLNHVVQHNPGDLTATVEAGITIAGLQRALGEHGQFLALDSPLPERSTVGGTLAAGAVGPLRWQFGNPRDLVIGMKVVQADAKVTKSGGQVVKNVSGYDMARLHIGGLGTLGIIAEVSFKLTPLPQHNATLIAAFDNGRQCLAAGLDVADSHAMPLALTSFDDPVNRRTQVADMNGTHFLAMRLGGRPRTLERQVNDCRQHCHQNGSVALERLDESDACTLWRKLADFGWDETADPLAVGRVSVLPTKIPDLMESLERGQGSDAMQPAVISEPGYGSALISWLALDGVVEDDKVAGALSQAREAAHDAGGRMIIERCPLGVKAQLDVWDDVGEPLAIMRRMKQQYDPERILNPGRFVGGL